MQWKQKLKKMMQGIARGQKTLSKMNKDESVRIEFEDNTASKYSGYVYDAVYMYALALDKMIRMDKALIQDLHSEKTVNQLVKIIKELDFDGVSGRIKFENGHSRLSEIKIRQFEVTSEVLIGNTSIIPSNLSVKEIGLYRPQVQNKTGQEQKMTWHDDRIRYLK